MRPMPRTLSFTGVVALAVLLGPAVAEENRLLPFWAQPYPAGYAPREPAFVQASRDCRLVRPTRAHRFGVPIAERCPTVLHARD
jgi:hypothetical protein